MFNKLGNIKLLPPVSWFNIKQLAGTAYKSIVSKIIGEQSDRRLMLALASSEIKIFDYTKKYRLENNKPEAITDSNRDELWLDFIADTGDGWNSTYTVAYYASKPEIGKYSF